MRVICRLMPGAALAALGCGPTGPLPDPAPAQVEAAMQRYTGFLRTGPPDSLAAFYTTDGTLVNPGMAPVVGPAAILAFLAPLAAVVTVDSAATTTDSIAAAGDSATQWGGYRETVTPRGRPTLTVAGHYVAQWRRGAERRWRIRRFVALPAPVRPPV